MPGLDSTATHLRFFGSSACEVIVVDDDDDVRAHLVDLLESAGYRVRPVASGEDALRAVDQSPCSIVLCDWEMPGMDGLALCRSIRERQLVNYVYVVMLTVRASHDDVMLGLNAGADDFVVKGTPSAELLARLSVGRRIAGLEASLRAAIEESRRLAMTDGLTGARNEASSPAIRRPTDNRARSSAEGVPFTTKSSAPAFRPSITSSCEARTVSITT